VHGLAEFRAKLTELPRKLQSKVLRSLMRNAMTVVREAARAKVPTLKTQPRNPDGTPRRLPGTVRKAISVRNSKVEARAGNVGVFVNVRPLPGSVYRGRGRNRVVVRKSQRSAANPRDPYYWRWIEFGTQMRRSVRSKRVKLDKRARYYPATTGANRGRVKAYAFLQTAAGRLEDAVKRFTTGLNDWIAKVNSSGRID
jgi:HK97 gp10 family phage protein